MKRNEILGEHKKGTKAVKYNKKPKDHTAEFSKAKEKLAPQKPMEESRWDRRDSYQRDYDSSVSGMGDDYKRDFKRREMEHELGHETNNYAVAIDGRTWKVFASKNHAQAVARSLQNKGKNASVHETGAEPTAEAMGADMGKITKVDPATKKATLTKPDGSSMEVDSTALKPTPDGKMSMDTPDTDELKMGTAVVSTEDMGVLPTTDSSSPISGDEENVDLRRLRELAGELSEAGEGMSDEYLQQVVNGAPGRHMITPEKAKAELARRAAGGKQNSSAPKDDAGDSAPIAPKDYQTKEPLTKGPDGKWRNSKGEERDGLHGGPVNNGAAMFRSMTPRAPTQESTELTAMLRIAGLRK